jgi:hypothetical protein
MGRFASLVAKCLDWLRRTLDDQVEYDWDGGFPLILPPFS